MATKLIEYVQFHIWNDIRYEDFDFILGKWYRVVEKSHECYKTAEFYENNDDGYEEEVTYDVITYYNDKQTDWDCIKLDGLKYTIIEVEVECDENDRDQIRRSA